ncbi:tyrosine-type recombinase/integrase [Pandoraea fibrosis]|uniref:Tyrosine-type recombinase/integrase n=1 Tax=Pandoraea fibrosis TaxID=1891094 RepID=A0ABX6HSW4_9BURK|nr:site-specific integrase [Pandoraea fibrosis]QHE92472.1 tyrosine-type recombinase/integrase [Pandoraea fibrosis]QHF13971.1 tyrosine-type recombinase/integrase [Pandoraea fibrosis]
MSGKKITSAGIPSPDSTSRAITRKPPAAGLPAPLNPAALDTDAREAAQALAREGDSANTRQSYQSAMRYWMGWYQLRYGQALVAPLSPAVIVQFVVDHAQHQGKRGLRTEMPEAIEAVLVAQGLKARPGPPALATLLHRLSVIAKLHTTQDLPNPCAEPAVRELLAKTRRAYAKRGVRTSKKEALTREPLRALLATCDDSMRGKRDRALLLFAWASGGRRRSEVVRATCENVRRTGPEHYAYTLSWSKTNQQGADLPENEKPVVGAAAVALTDWLTSAGITDGPIFRRVRRGGHVGEPLSEAAVRDIVRERCALAGLEGDFSAHSLRAGFVTEAALQQVPLAETMTMTGHTSVATVIGYFRRAEMQRSRAADLMGNDDTVQADGTDTAKEHNETTRAGNSPDDRA